MSDLFELKLEALIPFDPIPTVKTLHTIFFKEKPESYKLQILAKSKILGDSIEELRNYKFVLINDNKKYIGPRITDVKEISDCIIFIGQDIKIVSKDIIPVQLYSHENEYRCMASENLDLRYADIAKIDFYFRF